MEIQRDGIVQTFDDRRVLVVAHRYLPNVHAIGHDEFDGTAKCLARAQIWSQNVTVCATASKAADGIRAFLRAHWVHCELTLVDVGATDGKHCVKSTVRTDCDNDLLVFVLVQSVSDTTCALLDATARCDAQLLALRALLALSRLRTVLLIFAVRTIELAIANMLLVYANVRVCHIFVQRTGELANFAQNGTIVLVVSSLTVGKPVAQPRFLKANCNIFFECAHITHNQLHRR